MKMNRFAGLVVAVMLSTLPIGASAQAKNGAAPSVTASNTNGAAEPTAALMTLTVHGAWVKSGRNEDKFFDMVKQLAAESAENRGVTLPDTEAAGRKMGMLIKTSARRDPDQLLYAVVDSAVRQTSAGTAASSSAKK